MKDVTQTSLVVLRLRYPPTSAGDMGSIPGLGRSHMPRGLHTTTAVGEASAMGSPSNAAREQPPLAATGESPHTATKTHWAAKDK